MHRRKEKGRCEGKSEHGANEGNWIWTLELGINITSNLSTSLQIDFFQWNKHFELKLSMFSTVTCILLKFFRRIRLSLQILFMYMYIPICPTIFIIAFVVINSLVLSYFGIEKIMNK